MCVQYMLDASNLACCVTQMCKHVDVQDALEVFFLLIKLFVYWIPKSPRSCLILITSRFLPPSKAHLSSEGFPLLGTLLAQELARVGWGIRFGIFKIGM